MVADPVQKVILTKEERIDKLINDIGGLGRFQFFAFFIITFGISGMNYCIFILGYLIQQPVYTCTYSGTQDDSICTSANICAADPRISSWEIETDHELSLNNW